MERAQIGVEMLHHLPPWSQASARWSGGFAISRRGMEGKAPWWVSSTAPRPVALPRAAQPIGRRRAKGGWTCPDSVPHSTSLVSLAAVLEPFLTRRRAPSQAPTVAFSPQRCSTLTNPLHGLRLRAPLCPFSGDSPWAKGSPFIPRCPGSYHSHPQKRPTADDGQIQKIHKSPAPPARRDT